MEQFEEHISDDRRELVDSEFHEQVEAGTHFEEHHEENAWTDDPVRVYLREMGSVSLLSRQGEIHLAQRMERGKYLIRKALSRSPLVWRRVLALQDDLRQGAVQMEDFFDLGSPDEDAREEARREVARRLSRFARAHKSLLEMEAEIPATPARYVNLRARLIAKLPRLRVKCSQELRAIRFNSDQWKQFLGDLEHAVEEISTLEQALRKPRMTPAETRQLKKQILELEKTAGARASQMWHWLKTARRGQAETTTAKSALVEANLRLVVSVAKKYV